MNLKHDYPNFLKRATLGPAGNPNDGAVQAPQTIVHLTETRQVYFNPFP